jgi:hypothetical protein
LNHPGLTPRLYKNTLPGYNPGSKKPNIPKEGVMSYDDENDANLLQIGDALDRLFRLECLKSAMRFCKDPVNPEDSFETNLNRILPTAVKLEKLVRSPLRDAKS